MNENDGSWNYLKNLNIKFIRIVEKYNMIHAYCDGNDISYNFDKNKPIVEIFMGDYYNIKRITSKFDTAMLILVE